MSFTKGKALYQVVSASTPCTWTGTWSSHIGSYFSTWGHCFIKIRPRDNLNIDHLAIVEMGHEFLRFSLYDFEHQQGSARVSRAIMHLPAIADGFLLMLKPSLTNTRVRKPRLGNTLLCLFELLPNIWDLFKHTIC